MRNISIAFFFLIVSLVLLTVFAGVPKTQNPPILRAIKPHMYEKEDISIEKIHVTIFYFVPKDKVVSKDDGWKEITKEYMKRLLAFHSVQFRGTSRIEYEFLPEPIIGKKDAKDYESLFEENDKDALTPIKNEFTERVLTEGGDLFSTFPVYKNPSSRNVYLVIFEGAGAAGNDDFALISKEYVTNPSYKEDGATFLAHEFYHTLGVIDNYQIAQYGFRDGTQVPVSLLTRKDIMGQVNIPLNYTYLGNEILKKMGL